MNLPHPEIIAALEPGMQLLIDDGRLRLTVVERHADAIETRVVAGGELSDRKGVNVPEAVLEAFAADGEGPPGPDLRPRAGRGLGGARSCNARRTSRRRAS